MGLRELLFKLPGEDFECFLNGISAVNYDAGRLTPSDPSTVVDCMGRQPRVIRPGAIPARVLRDSVPGLIGDA